MTVRELIAALSEMPLDSEAYFRYGDVDNDPNNERSFYIEKVVKDRKLKFVDLVGYHIEP